MVDGQRLTGVDAYGKHLLLDAVSGDSVHVHLGMRGKWLRFGPVTGPDCRRRGCAWRCPSWPGT